MCQKDLMPMNCARPSHNAQLLLHDSGNMLQAGAILILQDTNHVDNKIISSLDLTTITL